MKHAKQPRMWTPGALLLVVIVGGSILLGIYFGLREWERRRIERSQAEQIRRLLR
jgi:hypothetical protein